MAKISKHYRLEDSTLKDIEILQSHLDLRLESSAKTTGMKFNKSTATMAIEFAIKYTLDNLKNEQGYER